MASGARTREQLCLVKHQDDVFAGSPHSPVDIMDPPSGVRDTPGTNWHGAASLARAVGWRGISMAANDYREPFAHEPIYAAWLVAYVSGQPLLVAMERGEDSRSDHRTFPLGDPEAP